MCSSGLWGVPDFGLVIQRERITSNISRHGTCPTILCGSPGCGKSIAAANYVLARAKRAIWIDACGEFLTAEQVAARTDAALVPSCMSAEGAHILPVNPIEGLLSLLRDVSEGQGFCIVIDDIGSPADEQEERGLDRLARLLRSVSSQLILTTRSIEGWSSDTLCGWQLLGDSDLALELDEARALVERAGVRAASLDSPTLLTACNGHAALFAVMLSQALTFGIDQESVRTPNLDAWLRRLVFGQLSAGARDVLNLAALIKSGDERDLDRLGAVQSRLALIDIAKTIPLVSCSMSPMGVRTFRVHDLVEGFLADNSDPGDGGGLPGEARSEAIRILTERGDLHRACRLLPSLRDRIELVDWIETHGRQALAAGMFRQLVTLLELVPVHILVGRHRVLLLWAELCSETGDFANALAKCQAARTLAEHEADEDATIRAALLTLRCLCRCHMMDDAEELASELMGGPLVRDHPGLHAQALLCIGQARLTRGDDPRDALAMLDAAGQFAERDPSDWTTPHTAATLSAIVEVLAHGDWMAGARRLSSLVGRQDQSLSNSVMSRGNLGLMLTQVGRLDRAGSLLRRAVHDAEVHELGLYVGAYKPPLGWLLAASGNTAEGLELIREGIEQAECLGDEQDAQLDRVYLATVLRSARRVDESLSEAEYAFERLSVADNMGFRRLAALEVAASLLALGDIAAARAWTESVAAEGPPPNPYHRLRSDMILAEAERREDRLPAAVKRLAAHKEYVRSENANWQIAMYCRAFPEMLGVLSLAIGPKSLPSHLCRMILPEHAEVILGRTKAFMPDKSWRQLGLALLGQEEFVRFIERDGLPLCHVRMFGGLEVSIGERSIRERDWKKRKARLLFTLLMMQRGQDIAREQIFDHLWPGMDEARAKSNLYVIWSTMKSVLMGATAEKGAKCPYVESVGGVCRSIRDTVRTDVDAFEAACSRAHKAEAEDRPADALKAYREISELYRGDLLPGDCYEDWFVNLREHYRSEFMDAMLRATEILLADNDPHTALIFVRRAIQHDQFREDLYQAALRCQIAAGQRSSAIETYMQCRDRLCEELGLDPSAEMRALYDEILAMEDRATSVAFDPLAD